MSAVNLDHLDTTVPAGGALFEFRGVEYRLKKAKIADQFQGVGTKESDFESESDVQTYIRDRLFFSKKDVDRFWGSVNSVYKSDGNPDRSPLSFRELIALIVAMIQIGNGTYSAGDDPKDSGS